MTKEQLEALWRDRHNYRYGFYYCKADPRAIVPKRFKWMGWTVNAARPSAIPWLLFILAILAVPSFVFAYHGAGTGVLLFVGAASIAVVCVLCAYLSSRTQ